MAASSFLGKLSKLFSISKTAFNKPHRIIIASSILEALEKVDYLKAIKNPQKQTFDEVHEIDVSPFFITTNNGLYCFENKKLSRLVSCICFGVDVHEDKIFLGISAGDESYVVKGKVGKNEGGTFIHSLKEIYSFKTKYHNERIHQILYDASNNTIVCAHTRKNSLLRLCADSGEIRDELYIMQDKSGFPIHHDHNHVNTVTKIGDTLLIALHNAGNDGSAIGYYKQDQIKLFSFKDRGVHDAMIIGKDLLFTNSFNGPRMHSGELDKGGLIWGGKEPLLDQINAVEGCFALRGLSYKKDKLIVGASCYAKRENRFDKNLQSGFFIFKGQTLEKFISGPFSQVYDIFPLDGIRSDETPSSLTLEELDTMLTRSVGSLLMERNVKNDFAY